MKMNERRLDVVYGEPDLVEIFSFKKFPIYMGVTKSPREQDILMDMNWGISKCSGVIQLLDLVPLDLLYRRSHKPGITGGVWAEHHAKFAEFIKETKFSSAVEIGGATGSLFKHFLGEEDFFQWFAVEPSGEFEIHDDRVKVIPDYFEAHDFDSKKFDIVVHSHVIEHIYEPEKFLRKSNELLEVGGVQYMSFPNMKYWLEHGFTNTLMFEHSFYIDLNVISKLLEISGFEVESHIEDAHSIFVKAKKVLELSEIKNNDSFEVESFDYIEGLFLSYINRLVSDYEDIREKLGDDEFYLFGAHIFSQMLLNLGLNENKLVAILDNQVAKHNKRLYGTSAIVSSPEVLRKKSSPIVIVRAGAYTDEIIKGILNINPTARFI